MKISKTGFDQNKERIFNINWTRLFHSKAEPFLLRSSLELAILVNE